MCYIDNRHNFKARLTLYGLVTPYGDTDLA